MSNSSLVTYTLLSPNRTHPRNHAIDTVTIHCFVGQVTAKRGCEVFQNPEREASCNYVVGYDGSIGLCVEEADRSWCSGGSKKAGGMTGKQNDHRAITIEVASETEDPYVVTDAAFEALIRLVADIAKRNPGIGRLRWQGDKDLVGQVAKQNMTVHRWFDARACPGEYLYERYGEIARRANEIMEGEVDMTKQEVREYVAQEIAKAVQSVSETVVKAADELRGELKTKVYDTMEECPAWSRAAVAWAVESGYIRGDERGRLRLDASKVWALQVMYNMMEKEKGVS